MTIIDTSAVTVRCRETEDFPVVELDTLYGKTYLSVTADRTAYLSTKDDPLTINGVEYRLGCQFKYGHKPNEDADVPAYWHRVQSYGMNLRRKDYLSSNKPQYTEAAYKVVEENVIPLVCSFLTQNPDMVLRADRVALSNDIAKVADDFMRHMEEAEDLRKKYFDLIEKEKTL